MSEDTCKSVFSSITLNVEVFPTTTINDAVEEAQELATRLGIRAIKFDFNGVEVSVKYNQHNTTPIINEYYQKLHNKGDKNDK